MKTKTLAANLALKRLFSCMFSEFSARVKRLLQSLHINFLSLEGTVMRELFSLHILKWNSYIF